MLHWMTLALRDPVNIADELHRDPSFHRSAGVGGSVTDIFVPLEFLEGEMIRGDVLELPDLLEPAAAEFLKRVVKQIEHKCFLFLLLALKNKIPFLGGFQKKGEKQFWFFENLYQRFLFGSGMC